MQRYILYIGETKRKFNTRLREHQKAVEQKHPKKSALAEHCLQSNHTISWVSPTIYVLAHVGETDASTAMMACTWPNSTDP